MVARWRTLLAALIGLFVLVGATTTTASAAAFGYDVVVIARAGVHEPNAREGSQAQFNEEREASVSRSVGATRTSTTPVVVVVAPNGALDDFANHGSEFLDDGTRFPTSRLDSAAGVFDVPPHAANRMAQRGITNGSLQNALATQPFDYFHDGIWKVGFYDTGTRVFVGTVGDTITTTIKTGPNYIRNLQAASP